MHQDTTHVCVVIDMQVAVPIYVIRRPGSHAAFNIHCSTMPGIAIRLIYIAGTRINYI